MAYSESASQSASQPEPTPLLHYPTSWADVSRQSVATKANDNNDNDSSDGTVEADSPYFPPSVRPLSSAQRPFGQTQSLATTLPYQALSRETSTLSAASQATVGR